MNLLLLKFLINILSSKKVFQLLILLLFLYYLFPIITIFILTNVGIPAVSGKLARINTKTRTIEIHDPTGKLIAHLEIATVWPVKGIVTLVFEKSDLPYQPIHIGIDIADKIGDPVTLFLKGKVIDTESLSWGYGNYVVIDNGNNVTSLYALLSKIEVTKSQEVQTGDIIGLEGQTGWATSPHVHFQINVFGIPVNPRTFVTGNP